MNNPLTNYWTYEGITYTFTWLPGQDPESVSPITQAYGLCFDNSNKLLVIKTLSQNPWNIPGGTVEPGETLVETLQREVVEEANTTIFDIHYLGVQKVVNDKNDDVIYQSRFAARIKEIGPLRPDPDKGRILPRGLINPLEFPKLSGYGVIGNELVRLSMEKLGISE